MILYLPKIVKSVFKFGKAGYDIGKNFETKNVTVSQYGNTVTVSSYTENEGCLWAFILGALRFLLWGIFCVYVGPILTLKKYLESIRNLKRYKRTRH